jgi:hypothetical protein
VTKIESHLSVDTGFNFEYPRCDWLHKHTGNERELQRIHLSPTIRSVKLIAIISQNCGVIEFEAGIVSVPRKEFSILGRIAIKRQRLPRAISEF